MKCVYAGLDLSKNHYGLTLIDGDSIKIIYTNISNMTLRQSKANIGKDYIIVVENVNENFTRIGIRVNPNLNRIRMDYIKSHSINETIKNELSKIDKSCRLFLSLEDYIVMNNGIVSLVHTTEQFKYDYLNPIYDNILPVNRILFLCCNVTWKKLIGNEASRKSNLKDKYLNIKSCIRNNYPKFQSILETLYQLCISDVIIKDIIDSWALANAGTKEKLPLFKRYSDRLFHNSG